MSVALRCLRACALAVGAATLASCGGGSSNNDAGANPQTCSVNNPFRGDATSATRVGNLGTEKTWLRDYIDRKYLWYDNVPAVDASAPLYSDDTPAGFYASIDNYFLDLVRPLSNPPGKPVDQFSFTYPTAAWDALINSGSTAGWGVEWHFDAVDSATGTMNGIRIAFVHDASPAAGVGLRRGDRLVSIDGRFASATNDPAQYNALLDRLFPAAGRTMDFVVERGGAQLTKRATSADVKLTTTRYQTLDVGGQKVGYLLFNDHLANAEAGLTAAVDSMWADSVGDLVLDLRYNGGGYLYIASQLAYMIAGASATDGRAFERTLFSDKRSGQNEVAPFESRSCNATVSDGGLQCTTDTPLPVLNLQRVYLLTSASTCSASEAIINGLRGIGIDVRLIGSTTCGKPYGFFGQDNCGISYFPIEFQGVNDIGFGDYADGFVPGGTGPSNVPGCAANDDLDHPLGDLAEGQLATALAYRASVNGGNPACPPLAAADRMAPLSAGRGAARVIKPAALTNGNGRMPAR
ncbi:MAG TPA: S41 family peptidase [Burkholderiaceae bacterium]|nr:S41 family peptidase [Burkholderiaceae bacterium]